MGGESHGPGKVLCVGAAVARVAGGGGGARTRWGREECIRDFWSVNYDRDNI